MIIFYPPGDVSGQFIPAPPTCPNGSFIFECTIGRMNGITMWRVNGSEECILPHSTFSGPRACGSGSPFIAVSGTRFGTSATLFSSTLSGIATSRLDGTLVECFGPDFSRDAANMVGNNTLQIIGWSCISLIYGLHERTIIHMQYHCILTCLFNSVYTIQLEHQMCIQIYHHELALQYLWLKIVKTPPQYILTCILKTFSSSINIYGTRKSRRSGHYSITELHNVSW